MDTGIKKVTFYDAATGDAVQINKVSTSSSMKIKEPFSAEAADGTLVFAGEESALEIVALEEMAAQLETWMENETPLRAVVYGVDSSVLWNEDAPITVTPNIISKVGERNGYTVKIERKGGIHDIAAGNNILYLVEGWKDDDGNTIADGFTLDADSAPSTAFADNIQKLTGAATNVSMFAEIVYPVAGAKLNLFNNLTYDVWTANGNVQLVQYAYDNTILADSTTTPKEVLSVTLAAGVYKLGVYILSAADIASGEEVRIEDPYLGNRDSGKIRY